MLNKQAKDSGTSKTALSHFSQFLAAQMGLHFPRERWDELEQGIRAAARELGFGNVEQCIEALIASPFTRRQVEVLAGHLTVGETYFFREKAIFTALERQVLPTLIQARRKTGRRLRIWSAACCTGEEPYSIAILLDRLIPDLKDWNITILGTDINPHFLRKAMAGVYRDWSFRDTPCWIKERYFSRTREGRFEILPRIRDQVTWSYLNLAEGVYPSPLNNTDAFDVIFCRNVLMYFEQEQAKKVAGNLHRALVEGGYLIVSPSEVSHERFADFVPANFPGAVLYRKDSRITRRTERPPGGPTEAGQAPLPGFVKVKPEVVHLPVSRESRSLAVAEKVANSQPSPYEEALELYAQCRYDEVTVRLCAALAAAPGDAKIMVLLARAYASQGQLTEALTWCQKAVAVDKLNPACRYLLATILQELDRIEEAATALAQALYLAPDFALAHFALGNLTLRQGKHRAADRHFHHALGLLQALPQEDLVAEADGMTAGRLMAIIQTMIQQ